MRWNLKEGAELTIVNVADIWRERNVWYQGRFRQRTETEYENKGSTYQQGKISWIHVLSLQREMQISGTSKVSSKDEEQNQRTDA